MIKNNDNIKIILITTIKKSIILVVTIIIKI